MHLAIQEHAVTVHERMTFQEMLSALEAMDTGVITLSEPEQQQLRSLLLRKVDNLRMVTREWEDAAKRHADFARDHSDKKKVYENKVERLNSYIVYAMQSGGFDVLPGNECVVKLSRSERTETLQPATEEHLKSYPSFVKQKIDFVWIKDPIKKAIRDGATFDFAKVTEHFEPKFDLK
jgi:hypothetical protein